MTAALLDRPISNVSGCRFPGWCDGTCRDTAQIGGEQFHWSPWAGIFRDYDIDQRLGVQLFGYENDKDGIDPVRVYVAAGDDFCDEDGCPMPSDQAQALGSALVEFQPRSAYEDDLVYTAVDCDGSWLVSAEYRRPRWRRTGADRAEHVEFSIRPDSTRRHSIRVRLSVETVRAFGRCLIGAATQAAASNRDFGLADR